jgi:hypothetical protein
MKMAATSYDGTCKNCGANLSVWIEVRKILREYQSLKFGV